MFVVLVSSFLVDGPPKRFASTCAHLAASACCFKLRLASTPARDSLILLLTASVRLMASWRLMTNFLFPSPGGLP